MAIQVVDPQVEARVAARAVPELARLSRFDPAMFQQFVIKDERTGAGIKLSETHEAWHDLLSRHKRLVLWGHVESGKSTSVSISRVLWEIGRDPSLRVLILSNTHTQASRIINALAGYIEQSRELHMVFPSLVPTQRLYEPWKPLSGQLTVKRLTTSKDATITASGIHGSILGARYDLVVLDDVLDYENTRTVDQRKQTMDWLQATVHGRITRNGRMWVAGTAFHPQDVLHEYARRFSADGVQRSFKYPVLDNAGNPRWPEQWPLDRIEARRLELTPVEFARQMMCEARDDAHSRFKQEWINVALKRGEGKDLAYALKSVPTGCHVFTGVDLAVQQHSAADLTVLFTIIVHPNGDREVLEIQSGRWAGPDIVNRIVDVHHRFQSIVICENNSAQDFLLQFTRAVSSVPIRPFTTGRNKAHPEFGVESLATEIMNGKWIVPNHGGATHPEVQAWIQDMLYYAPAAHTGDRLMASWFAREGARQGVPRAEVGRLELMRR